MFKFALPSAVWWPVTIQVPADGGKTVAQECEVLVPLLDSDELIAIDLDRRAKLPAAIKDWRGIVDAEDRPIPCTEETKAALLKVPCVFTAFALAPLNAALGQREEREKN